MRPRRVLASPGLHRAMLSVVLALSVACGTPFDQEPAPQATQTAVPTLAPSPSPPTTTPPPTISLVAIGDLMLARDLVTLMDRYGAMYPFERVAPILADADITVANLEGPFTEGGTPADKKYVFRTPPRDAAGLALAGIDVVSLANNHALDFGPEGLRDTIAALDAVGIAHSGAGENDTAARRPAILAVRGLRVAFLSYAATADASAAAADADGVAWGTADTIGKDVRRASGQADVVVVSLHAGNEYADEPSDTQQLLAQAAIEAGATLVLGHHPHVLQRWESRGPSFVAYSLGNFVFDLDGDDLVQLGPAPFQTVALKISVSASGVEKVEPIPVYIDPQEDRPRLAGPAEAEAILDRIQQLAGDLETP
jgi:poly-gamma-glutamate capsule biosynthesis protein CapA/YwtB (metallophosphatase superfamily)